MIHEEKRKGGRPQKRKKHLRSDRSARETTFKKHLNHPFTVMQPFVLQHTCTRTHTLTKRNKIKIKKKKISGRSYESYYFHVVDERLDKSSKNTLNSLKPQQAS